MNNTSILHLIQSGALILDVRTKEEYNESHYPNAQNIPVDEIMTKGLHDKDKNAPIVLYCKSGARSETALHLLKHLGYTNVINAGGLKDMLQHAPSFFISQNM